MLTVMNGVRTIIKLLGDLVTFMWLIVRPRDTLAGENLFLRKQVAMYQERKQKPRRPGTPLRIALVLLSRLFDWKVAGFLSQMCGNGAIDDAQHLTHDRRLAGK